jgi:hypothetical protein
MKNKSFKKLLSSFLILSMLLLSISSAFVAAATSTSDIKGHWAENEISAWIDKGFIKGYEDGNFKPGNNITRAEFIALINRSFGFTETTAISFSDVAAGNWAYAEVAIAVKAGYITGYDDGTIGASKPISRQEVAVIVDRLLGLSNTENAKTSFADSGSIASWAQGAVNAAVAKQILKGYAEDNSFKPSKSITRAEAVVTLDRAVAAKAIVYSAAGTYGPVTGTETINGDVAINVAGVTLQNLVINGNLLFAAGIGSGDATLNNVTVTGQTKVEGGGENSIHFNNSIILTIVVDKKNGTVRIVAEGSTTVGEVTVNSPTTIQETGTTGTGFSKVTLSENLPADSKVTLKGSFDSLVIKGDKIQVDIPEGSVKEVKATSTGTGMTLNLGADAKIVSLILDAVVKMLGTGTIETATLSAVAKAETTFEKQPAKTEDKVEGTVTAAPTATPAPTPTPTTPSYGGGGGGGYVPTPTPVVTPSPTPTPVTPAPVISSVSIKSSNVSNPTKAYVGDTITLTFVTDQQLPDLSSITINGNISTVDSTVVGAVYQNVATYVLNDSDPLGDVTFLITLKNSNGQYLITTDFTTDGSSIIKFSVQDPETLLSNPSLTVYSDNLNKPWTYLGHTYASNTVFQVNVNFNSGTTSNDFKSAEVRLYDGNTLLATDTAKVELLNGHNIGLSDVFGMGDVPNAEDDASWIIGGYASDKKPTRVEFRLIDNLNILHIAQASMTPPSDPLVANPETLLSSPSLTIYASNLDQEWVYDGVTYDPNTVFQVNINFSNGTTSSDFQTAEVSLYGDSNVLLSTHKAKKALLTSASVGLSDVFVIGEVENTVSDTNWEIGAYDSTEAPKKVVFKLLDNNGVLHIVEAPLS